MGKVLFTYKMDINGDNKNETIQFITRKAIKYSANYVQIDKAELRINNKIKCYINDTCIESAMYAMTLNGKDTYLWWEQGKYWRWN